MPDCTVTGTVTPDCTGDYTDAGEYNGQRYYTCTNEAGTWYLWFLASKDELRWSISVTLGETLPATWMKVGSLSPIGIYVAGEPYSGAATVAEYVAPSSNPRLSGVLQLIITNVNGLELNPAKRLELEFDS